MSIWVDTIFVPPLASEKPNANVCDDPLPLLGVTETADGGVGGPLPVTFSVAEVL